LEKREYLQLLGKILQGGLLTLIDHDFHHLLADQLLLGALGIAGSSDLSGSSLSEADAEHSEEVTISGLGLNEGFNKCVPLLNEGAELVSGDVHSVEVSKAIISFNFFNLHLHLSPGLISLISVQIS
jgi:hypothetical protein